MDKKSALQKAYEVAIRAAIGKTSKTQKNSRGKKQVNITGEESMAMYNLFKQLIIDDREEALKAIAVASRAAASRPEIISMLIFSVMLAFVSAAAFSNIIITVLVIAVCALAIYIYYAPALAAARVWKRRDKSNPEAALKIMYGCFMLSRFKAANKAVLGGLCALIIVLVINLIFA